MEARNFAGWRRGAMQDGKFEMRSGSETNFSEELSETLQEFVLTIRSDCD